MISMLFKATVLHHELKSFDFVCNLWKHRSKFQVFQQIISIVVVNYFNRCN